MTREESTMSHSPEAGAPTHPDYLNDGYGIRSWLLTTDHKRIAMLYLMSVTVFFLMGSVFAALIRLELATPEGDLVMELLRREGECLVLEGRPGEGLEIHGAGALELLSRHAPLPA